ncbi:hypothetical protein COO91_05938 [Nostoc flagelliforme CCNUN1]|uniref:Uncharacterized protein n=1 Tax=Nostoc flagelliforme CCNUN1 TaxID=2038116 RepID=A0A2K8SWX9_9NOSO|nr:hypothetical protein COO91_05938 [Nostoc flagelliforme CCNUN1]
MPKRGLTEQYWFKNCFHLDSSADWLGLYLEHLSFLPSNF